MKKLEPSVIDIRLQDVGLIPGKYFLHDRVIEALESVIREDVLIKGSKVPTGTTPVYGPLKGTSAEAFAKVNVLSRGLFVQLWRNAPAVLASGVVAGALFYVLTLAFGRTL